MKRSSDAIKAELKRLGKDNRPSGSQGPNEQAPARGGGPPGSSPAGASSEHRAARRSRAGHDWTARETATSERCAHPRRPRSYHQVADRWEPWRLRGAKGVLQNGAKTRGDPPTLDPRDEERWSGGPPRGGSDRLEIWQRGPSTGES
jgi:hypothetical protein